MKRFEIFNVFGKWIQKIKVKVGRKKQMKICIDFIIRKDTALKWYEQKIHEKIDGIDLDLSITQNSTKMILVGDEEKIYKILYAVWELLFFYDGYFYTPQHYYVDGKEHSVKKLYGNRFKMYHTYMKYYIPATLLGRSGRDLSEERVLLYIDFREKGRAEQKMNMSLINSFFYINSQSYEMLEVEHRLSLLLNACDGLCINTLGDYNVNENILKVIKNMGKEKYQKGLKLIGVSNKKSKEILGHTRNELDHYSYKEKSVGNLISKGKDKPLEILNIFLCIVLVLAFRAFVLEYIGYNIPKEIKDNAMNLINDWVILNYDLSEPYSADENQLREFFRMVAELEKGKILYDAFYYPHLF